MEEVIEYSLNKWTEENIAKGWELPLHVLPFPDLEGKKKVVPSLVNNFHNGWPFLLESGILEKI